MEISGVKIGESCDKNEFRLNVSDALNDLYTESRATSVCNRLPASSASPDEQAAPGGRLLKDHVQATKTMEIYRTPPILIITLKRFKMGKSKYGFAVGGSKLDTLVNFPL